MAKPFIIHSINDKDIPEDVLTVWRPILATGLPFIQIDTPESSLFVSFTPEEATALAEAILEAAGTREATAPTTRGAETSSA
jgi:hypothetical protein